MNTPADQTKIAALLEHMHLPSGLGTRDEACSIAAINLALTGELTDRIPDCMSEVIGKWIIVTQDAMPDEMRNSARWKSLLPLAAGTGRDHEAERVALILDHMWTVTLPSLQPIADANGFGAAWNAMLTERSEAAASAAAGAAGAASAAASAAWAACAAAGAAGAASDSASAAGAADWAACAAVEAAGAAGAAGAAAWQSFDPCTLLERLIAVGGAA